jgi:hypothetical protein
MGIKNTYFCTILPKSTVPQHSDSDKFDRNMNFPLWFYRICPGVFRELDLLWRCCTQKTSGDAYNNFEKSNINSVGGQRGVVSVELFSEMPHSFSREFVFLAIEAEGCAKDI